MENEVKIPSSIKQEEEEIKWGGWLNEFLWICAGVNRKVLRQCPTDYAKYAGIGGTILFTALMAMLSGGYAINSVFGTTRFEIESLGISIGGTSLSVAFGIFWGLLIFNLDRFMVNTMYSDGTPKITKEELRGGIPRLILAVFLGIVISTPLELKIFEDKIKAQLLIDQGKVGVEIRQANDSLYQQRKEIEDHIALLNNQLAELQSGNLGGISSKVAEKDKELKEAEMLLYNETNGNGVTRTRGYGPAARQLQERVDRLRKEKEELDKQEELEKANNQLYIRQRSESVQKGIDEDQRRLAEKDKDISNKEKEGVEAQKALSGFSAQINALSEIASPQNTALFVARLLISLLFIAIEVIPTLFKMMMTSGPYDDLLRSEMHKIRVLSDKKISDINDKINTDIQISTETNKQRQEIELQHNKILMEEVAAVQAELISKAIAAWRESELKKIEENPSLYIKTNEG